MEFDGSGVHASFSERPGVVVLRLGGDIDRATLASVQAAFERVLTSPEPRLDLDLSGVTFFGSEGLHALEELKAACDSSGRQLVLHGVPRMVVKVLEITGTLDDFTLSGGPPADPHQG
jgi:anti-anti-sigma factor